MRLLALICAAALLAAACSSNDPDDGSELSVDCVYDFEATVRDGPNAGTEVLGYLSIGSDDQGAQFAALRTAPETELPVGVAYTGRSIALSFDMGSTGAILGTGTLPEPLSECRSTLEGDFIGPTEADRGDWEGVTFNAEEAAAEAASNDTAPDALIGSLVDQPLLTDPKFARPAFLSPGPAPVVEPTPTQEPATALPGIDLTDKNLIARDLSGLDFSGLDLSGFDFTSAIINGTKFDGAKLTGARFGDVEGTGASFGNANLKGAVFTDATLSEVVFDGADLTDALLLGVNIYIGSFDNTNFTGANLSDAIVIGYSPSNPGGPRSSFATANFTNAILTGALCPGLVLMLDDPVDDVEKEHDPVELRDGECIQ